MTQKIKKTIKYFLILIKFFVHLNITKTIYINFKTQCFKNAIKFPILIYGKLKIKSIKGKIIFKSQIRNGLLQIGIDIDGLPIAQLPSILDIDGKIIINGRIALNHGSGLYVGKDSIVTFGNQVMICSGVVIKSETSITIGDDVVIASGCFIMDTNMHSIRDTINGQIKRRSKPISIGKECWLTMYTSVMAGSVIPNYCITARYSYLNKDYSRICEDGSLLAGSPAIVIAKNKQKVFDYELENQIYKYFKSNPESEIYESKLFSFIDWKKERIHPVFKVFR